MTEPRLVTVYVSQGMLPAQVVRGKLETAGIPVLLKYEAIGQIIGLTVDGLGRVEVLVPEECVADAEYLLQEDEGGTEPEDDSSPTE
jgi:hypothetical protein